jgi:MATE family multidrug resistance protein
VSSVRREVAAQVSLAVPLAAQQLGLVLMGLVDTAILGRYHPDAMAGAGVGNSLFFALTCIGLGVLLGLDPLLTQALGAGERWRTPRLVRDGVAVAIRLGAVLSLAIMATPLLLDVAGVEPAVADEARVFVYGRVPGVIPFLAQLAYRGALQAHGYTRPLVLAVVVGNLVNAALDLVLVFGVPAIGLPALGSIGSALATSLVTIATTIYFAAAVGLLVREAPPPPAGVDPARSSARDLLRVGAPIGLQLAAEVGAFAMASVLAGRLGKVPSAAHQIAIQLASTSFAIAMALGATAAIRVGLAVGAGDHRAARRAGLVTLGLGTAVMSSSALLFVAAPGLLAGLFGTTDVVLAAALPLIQIAAVFQLSDGAQAIGAGALRGAGDTRAAFLANLGGHYLLGVPIAIALGFGAALGAPGLWWGLTAGLTATAAALVGRFVWLTARPVARIQKDR